MKYPPHIDLTQPCWVHTGYTNNAGYGVTVLKGKPFLKHRVSYSLFNNADLKPLHFVCHACDNPPCWNPAHLFVGSVVDNNADKKEKRRHPYGQKHGASKLTDEKVKSIRASKDNGAILAKRYGVSRNVIHCIRTGKTWKHVV